MGGRIDSGSIISSEEASLQLSNPIPALSDGQTFVARHMAFESRLIEPPVVKGAKFRRRTTECSDKPDLCSDDINDETEPNLLGKLEAVLGFTLNLKQRISRRQQVRIHDIAAVRRKIEVADLVCNLKSTTHQITASADMFRPWRNKASEQQVGLGLEAPQSVSFNQFIAEATEPKSDVVVAEVWPSYHAKV